MTDNNGRALAGTIENHAKDRGWFFGRFMDDELLQSNDVEVAWQHIGGLSPSPSQAHFHTSSVEINVVVAGRVQLLINGVPRDLRVGDFYVIWPEAEVSDLHTDEGTQIVVVRTPSVDDKVQRFTPSDGSAD